MKIELLTRREELAALIGAWEELAQSDPRDGFFRTPAWYLSWIEHIRPDAQPFVLVARDDQGRLVGLAPLCKLIYKDHGFRLTAVSPAGREVVSGDFLDYLAASHVRQDVLEAILNSLWDARSEWELMVVGEIPEKGDLHRAIISFAERHNVLVREQEQRICPYIELPPIFEDYLHSLSPNMRYKLRRDSRDLLDKQGAQIEVFSNPREVSEHLPILIELHLAHWQRANQPGTLGRPGFARFLQQVCAHPSNGASSRLYILNYENKPAAALLAFWFGETALFYQSGWDPDSPAVRRCPGMVLQARSIRDALEHGFRFYDFLRGDETYKWRFTKSSRKTLTLLVARSFLAKEYLRAARLKDSLKRILAPGQTVEPVARSTN